VVLLPSAFWLICGSAFEARARDAAHHAFMNLPLYTRAREGEAPQLGNGPKPCRVGLGGQKPTNVADFRHYATFLEENEIPIQQ
jgi:hypothetical protein